MAYRGKNQTSNTVQIYNSSINGWQAFETLTFTSSMGTSTVFSTENLALGAAQGVEVEAVLGDVELRSLAGDIVLNSAQDLTITAGDTNFSGSVTIQNNLQVLGTTTSVNTENMEVRDAFINLNVGYTGASGTSSGLAVNIQGSATTANVAGAGFTATTVAVDERSGFAPNDIIQVKDAADAANTGFFAIDPAYVPDTGAGTLTIKTVGLNNPIILQDAFSPDTTVAGEVTKVSVSAIRSNAGTWEITTGPESSDAAAFSYDTIAAGGGNSLNAAYLQGNTITALDTPGDIEFNLTETTDFVVDAQSTGGLLVQDSGSNVLSVTGAGAVAVTPTGGQSFSVSSVSSANVDVSLATGGINLLTVDGNVGMTSTNSNVSINAGAGSGTGTVSITGAGNSFFDSSSGSLSFNAATTVTSTAGTVNSMIGQDIAITSNTNGVTINSAGAFDVDALGSATIDAPSITLNSPNFIGLIGTSATAAIQASARTVNLVASGDDAAGTVIGLSAGSGGDISISTTDADGDISVQSAGDLTALSNANSGTALYGVSGTNGTARLSSSGTTASTELIGGTVTINSGAELPIGLSTTNAAGANATGDITYTTGTNSGTGDSGSHTFTTGNVSGGAATPGSFNVQVAPGPNGDGASLVVGGSSTGGGSFTATVGDGAVPGVFNFNVASGQSALVMGSSTNFGAASTNDVFVKGASGQAEWVSAGSIVGVTQQAAYDGSAGVPDSPMIQTTGGYNFEIAGSEQIILGGSDLFLNANSIRGGTSGSVNANAGGSTDAGSTGGGFSAIAGVGENASGAQMTVSGGSPLAGGAAFLQGGSGTANDAPGGVATVTGGDGFGAGNGGNAVLQAGDSTTGTGGNVVVAAGSGATGGNVSFTGETMSHSIGGSTGTVGQVLTATGGGNTTWQDAPATGAPAKSIEPYTASSGALTPTVVDLEANEITYTITTDAALAVTLPTPEPAAGTMIRFKDVSGGAATFNVTISATNGIDGSSVPLANPYAAVGIQSLGTGNGYIAV